MTYLFTNNQEIKNTQDGPISIAVYDTTGDTANVNSITHPLYVAGNVGLTSNQVFVTNDTAHPVNISGNVAIIDQFGNYNSENHPVYVSSHVSNVENDPVLVKFADRTNPQLDAQQRLRVTIPAQQWWYTPSVDKDGDLRFQELFVGADANSHFLQNLANINITSGLTYNSNTALTGQAIRGSRRRHKIRPGVSHEFFSIHNWDGVQPNVTKRRGMFTNYNGIFYEVSDKLYAVVRRRLLDGTLVERKVPFDQFSEDVLDGTGESGLDFRESANTKLILTGYVTNSTIKKTIPASSEDVYNVTYTTSSNTAMIVVGSKATITGVTPSTYNGVVLIQSLTSNTITVSYPRNPGVYSSISSGLLTHTGYHHMNNWWVDFNGGRTSKVRFGVNGSNGPIVLHIEEFIDSIGTQYENAPALMDRTEIINTGIPDYIPSFTTAGSAFNIEAESELNPGFGIAQSTTAVTFNKDQHQEFAILGIALRAGEPYQRADLQLQGVDIVDIGNINQQNSGVYQWKLVLNPTLSGSIPATTNVGKTARIWDYAAGVTVSGGIDLFGGYITSTSQIDVKTSLNFLNMGSNLDYSDSDKIVLVMKELTGGTGDGQIMASINFIEAL